MYRILYHNTLLTEFWVNPESAWEEIQARTERHGTKVTYYKIVQITEFRPVTRTITVFEKV